MTKPGWKDANKLLMTVATNATVNTGTIWSPTSESSCLPSLKGLSSSVILKEYPSPMKRTRQLQTVKTLMLSGQNSKMDCGHQGYWGRNLGTIRTHRPEPDQARRGRRGEGLVLVENAEVVTVSVFWFPEQPAPPRVAGLTEQRLSGSDAASRLGSGQKNISRNFNSNHAKTF